MPNNGDKQDIVFIDPEDGLFDAMEQLKAKLGPEGFLRALSGLPPDEPHDEADKSLPHLDYSQANRLMEEGHQEWLKANPGWSTSTPASQTPTPQTPEKPSVKPAAEPATSEKPYRNQKALDNYLKNNPGASPEDFKAEVERHGF